MIRQLVQPPSTWEGWAMRVLTIAVIFVFGAAVMIVRQVAGVMDYMAESRAERYEFQVEQQQRTCLLLKNMGLSERQLEEVACSSK
jgi:hypothetical protein